MRSAVELTQMYVGKKGLLTVGSRVENKTHGSPGTIGIQCPVVVTDARTQFGKENVLVMPHRGVGSEWFSVDNLVIVDEWPNATDPITTTPSPDESLPSNPDGSEMPAA